MSTRLPMATKNSVRPTSRTRTQLRSRSPQPARRQLARQSVNVRPRAASANSLQMKHTVSEITLKNGSKGLLIHIPDASVMSFELNFRAGEYLVDEKKWETPHLMEHILLGA